MNKSKKDKKRQAKNLESIRKRNDIIIKKKKNIFADLLTNLKYLFLSIKLTIKSNNRLKQENNEYVGNKKNQIKSNEFDGEFDKNINKTLGKKVIMIEKTVIFTFLIILITIISIIITSKLKISTISNVKEMELLEEKDLKKMLEGLKQKNKNLSLELEKKDDLLKKYTDMIKNNESNEKIFYAELKRTRNLLGENKIIGSGIEITLENGENVVDSMDIMLIVNELKNLGVEYISINDYRYTPISYLSYVKLKGLIMDKKILNIPYKIKAICDSNKVFDELNTKNGILDMIKYDKKKIKITKEENIEIKEIEGKIHLKYGK